MEELSGAGEVILKSPLEIFSGVFPNFPTNRIFLKLAAFLGEKKKISLMIWFTFGGKI